jgi:predicted DNA binding CopG/RHH family protein
MLCFGRTKAGRLLTILYTMPKKPITIPKFRTEAQEADWWDTHPEAATEIMRRAIKSGKARRAAPLKTVTMRLPVPDILAAQDLAHQKGLPYQTYIKMLLHEALKKERSA